LASLFYFFYSCFIFSFKSFFDIFKKSKNPKEKAISLLSGFLVSIFLFLITSIIYFFSLLTSISIRRASISRIYHKFNAHLTDLCVNRADKSECPRNESELEAFNPELYEELNSLTETEFIYSEEDDQVLWKVRFVDGYLTSGSAGMGYQSKYESKE